MTKDEHIHISNGDMRMSGTHPIDCMFCGLAMTLQEMLDFQQDLLVKSGLLIPIGDGKHRLAKGITNEHINAFMKGVRNR